MAVSTGGFDLLTAEAYRQYRDTLTESERHALDLFQKLSADKWLMRVLYMAYMNVEATDVDGRDVAADRAEAREQGLIFTTRRRTRLSRDGFALFWAWKSEITPHLRQPAFQELWREVCGW